VVPLDSRPADSPREGASISHAGAARHHAATTRRYLDARFA